MLSEYPTGSVSESDESRVLVLPPTGADGTAISKLFEAHDIPHSICRQMWELCARFESGAATLVVSEEAIFADTDELSASLSKQPVWSDVPIIVLSRSGRESSAFAQIVASLGNASVIERPIRTTTLISLVRSTLRARERQYQVRRHLLEQESAQRVIHESMDAERAARSDAERANRMKDEFLATLSHELRTPLNAILGWTHVLKKSRDLAKDAPNALTVIERNARAQAQIVQDLLDMSSIISGKVRLEIQAVDLASVIEATVESVRPALQAKNINLAVALDPLAGPLRGDPNRLQQVFWNLLTNAVKFTAREGKIAVTLVRTNSHLEVDVTDNGEGMDPAFVPYVFDRFRQADNSSARIHGGLGLGLAIVKQLVELHGGTVAARSAGKGAGSTFSLLLPLMPLNFDTDSSDVRRRGQAKALEAQSAEVEDLTDLSGVQVLVVDDEPDSRVLIERLLQERKARVSTAASAAEAFALLTGERFDLLISDIGMPGEDGYTLITRMRASGEPNMQLPAIALTAFVRTEDRVRAIRAGFQSHLSKPVDPTELIAMVRSLTQRA